MNPKGGEKWTVECLDEELDLKFERGPVELKVSEYIERLRKLAFKINATLRGETSSPEATEVQRDTKRLDWAILQLILLGVIKAEMGTTGREAIDAAMKEQG